MENKGHQEVLLKRIREICKVDNLIYNKDNLKIIKGMSYDQRSD